MVPWQDGKFSHSMINHGRILTSLSVPEHFTNDTIKHRHNLLYLSRFHINHGFQRAVVANTYLETVVSRSNSIHIIIEYYSEKWHSENH